MEEYAWIIDKDFINGIKAGITGPINISDKLLNCLERDDGVEFRMYDDDGVLYYEGRIIGNYTGFEPLDDFGMPDSGCTEINYFENGKWSIL